MNMLKQENLKERFIIKIVHNTSAPKCCYAGNWENNINAFYSPKEKEICIPIHNFRPSTISHEIVHAVTYINELETIDQESLAYYIGEKMGRDYLWLERYY